MEEKDFGGIIFYIIAAIIGIVGSVAGKKKKQAASQLPDFESVDEDIPDPSYRRIDDPFDEARRRMEETIRRMTGEPVEMDYEQEGSYDEPMAAAASSEGVSSITESMVKEDRFDELVSSMATNRDSENDSLISVDEDSIGSDIAREFELKKAIIFSEIMKPKFSSY